MPDDPPIVSEAERPAPERTKSSAASRCSAGVVGMSAAVGMVRKQNTSDTGAKNPAPLVVALHNKL